MRKRFPIWIGALVGAACIVTAAHTAHAEEIGACAVLDSPFTLDQIVEKALDQVPGAALKAGFTVQPTGGEGPETLFKVKIAKEEGGRALLFFDTETGEPVEPVKPVLSLLDAYDLAVEAVENATDAGGAVVLKGALHRRVLVANYDFAIADPRAKLALARVDAITGEVRLLRPKAVAKAKVKRGVARKRGIYRHVSGKPFRCDSVDEEEDPEEQALLDG